MCILSVYTLLKMVGYYDFECSVHVSDGFPKNKHLMGVRWVGGLSSIQFFFGFLEFFIFAKPLSSN